MTQELEELILGCLLKTPALVNSCFDLKPDDFVFHGSAFEAMRDHYQKYENLSLALLKPQFVKMGYEPQSLLFFKAQASHADFEYLKTGLKDHSGKRKIMQLSEKLAEIANNPAATFTECLDLLNRAKTEVAVDVKSIGQIEILRKMKEKGIQAERHSTGLHGLDQLLVGGFHKGRVYGFSGRAKGGKTMLAITIAYNLMLSEVQHTYVAMEMGSTEICQRLFARQMNHNSLAYLHGDKTPDDVKPNNYLRFIDAPGITWDELKTAMITEILNFNPHGFVIDYWQLIKGNNHRDTEEKHLRDVAQGLADFAKKHNVWIFLLSQSSDDGKLFGGKGLEKACDILFFIENSKNEAEKDLRWLRMAVTRYTPQANHGSEKDPSLRINKKVGPYFEEI